MVKEQAKQASLFDEPATTSQPSSTREEETRVDIRIRKKKNIAQNGLAARNLAGPNANIIASGTKNHVNLKTGQFLCFDCGRDTGIGTLIKGYVYCEKCARKRRNGK